MRQQGERVANLFYARHRPARVGCVFLIRACQALRCDLVRQGEDWRSRSRRCSSSVRRMLDLECPLPGKADVPQPRRHVGVMTPSRKSLEPPLRPISGAGHGLKFSTVVGPVKKSLSLAFAAGLVTGFAVQFDLPDVSSHGPPSPDLSKVFLRRSAAHIISQYH
jgi:hypothetical protein